MGWCLALQWLLAGLLLVAGGCATRRAYHRALHLAGDGRYAEAMDQDLLALSRKPDYADARQHLAEVTPHAVQQQLRRGAQLEQAGNSDEAVYVYEQLSSLLARAAATGAAADPNTVAPHLKRAQGQAAGLHYQRGTELSASGRWRAAAGEFIVADRFADGFRDARSRAVDAYVRLGDEQVGKQRLADALEEYRRATDLEPPAAGLFTKIADCHYQLGVRAADGRRPRVAYGHFRAAHEAVPGYRDAAVRRDEAFAAALHTVAVFVPPGAAASLRQSVRGGLGGTELTFARFLDGAAVTRRSGAHVPPRSFLEACAQAKKAGCTAVVWLQVTGQQVRDAPVRVRERMVNRQVTGRDKDGRQVTMVVPTAYREFRKTRVAQMQVAVRVEDLRAGQTLWNDRLGRTATASAAWATYEGAAKELPTALRQPLAAPRTVPAPAALTAAVGQATGETVSQAVLKLFE